MVSAMKLDLLVRALEAIAPAELAESWDNVGLLAGDRDDEISRVLLCIDFTNAVCDETLRERFEAVVAYHPAIFSPLRRIVGKSPLRTALRHGLAIYSPHTALDVADGGTNDVLADVLELEDRAPLRVSEAADAGVKLVTFVPREHVDQVSRALFDAGAGWIGNYSSCSFRSPGTGTFFGEAGAQPKIGEAGRLEEVEELRLETVVARGRIAAVVRALRRAHPYEEPAFDLLSLTTPRTRGIGRVGALDDVPREELFGRIRRGLGVERLLIAGPETGTVSRAAVAAGAAGSLLRDAIDARCGLLLTGEVRHHDALAAAQAGMTVVAVLHSNSERVALQALATRLAANLPELSLKVSSADRDPFTIR